MGLGRDLDLSNNTLTAIPRELGYLVNLEILFLDNNQLFDQTFFLFRAKHGPQR